MVLAARFRVQWGAKVPRKFYGEDHWEQPLAWNRKAAKLGVRLKVFCASMADVFEELPTDHPDAARMVDERSRLFALIDATPNLDWLLLTKRPENIIRMWAPGQMRNHPYRQNVWLGCTVEDQANADKRIPELLKCRDLSPVLFLSCEPLLGPLRFCKCWLSDNTLPGNVCRQCGLISLRGGFINWIIAGGESGPHARPSHPDWFRSLRDQCQAAGVAFHFKQWGNWVSSFDYHLANPERPNGLNGCESRDIDYPFTMWNIGKKLAGRLLDGIEHNGTPEVAK